MLTLELLNRVKALTAEGISKDRIKTELIKEGWSEIDISEALGVVPDQKPEISLFESETHGLQFKKEIKKSTIFKLVIFFCLLVGIGFFLAKILLASQMSPEKVIAKLGQITSTRFKEEISIGEQKNPLYLAGRKAGEIVLPNQFQYQYESPSLSGTTEDKKKLIASAGVDSVFLTFRGNDVIGEIDGSTFRHIDFAPLEANGIMGREFIDSELKKTGESGFWQLIPGGENYEFLGLDLNSFLIPREILILKHLPKTIINLKKTKERTYEGNLDDEKLKKLVDSIFPPEEGRLLTKSKAIIATSLTGRIQKITVTLGKLEESKAEIAITFTQFNGDFKITKPSFIRTVNKQLEEDFEKYFFENIVTPEVAAELRDGKRKTTLDKLKNAITDYLKNVLNPKLCWSKNTLYLSTQKTSDELKRGIGGRGWLPIDFTKIPDGPPFSELPIDPINNINQGLFFAYACDPAKQTFEINAKFESPKFLLFSSGDGGNDPKIYEVGNAPGFNLISTRIY